MLIPILLIIGGLVLLALGAEGLVRGSASVALRLGITPLVVGLTIVAFGTGSPELVVSISAAIEGNSSIALGNVVGSNISNVTLILGAAAIVRPLAVRAEVLKREIPVMLAVTAFLWLLLYDNVLSRFDGAILLTGSLAYTFLTYRLSGKKEKAEVEEEFEEAFEASKKSVWLDVIFIVAGLGFLILGANVLLRGAVTIAKMFGISEVVIGLTIIAIGTSLPELATSALAAVKNESDIAFGNAIGSNVLNILAVLGITALIQPSLPPKFARSIWARCSAALFCFSSCWEEILGSTGRKARSCLSATSFIFTRFCRSNHKACRKIFRLFSILIFHCSS